MKNNRCTERPWESVSPGGRMLRPAEVAERTGLSRSQIYALVAERRLPPLLKVGARASGMPEAWLDAYLAAQAQRALRNADSEVCR